MKIAIMAAWNTTSGVAMHAEPIGKALDKMGHKLTVFTFQKNDFHGEGITAKDERYVKRCFGTRNETNALDSRPLLEMDYDYLIVEDLGMLPVDKLANIFPIIRQKAKVVHVVHENTSCRHSWFYKLDWDKVIYFDYRQDFMKKIYPDAVFIPFPCFPVRRGNKIAARKRLGLPLKKKIIYCFEHRGYHTYYRDLPPRLKRDSILLHVVKPDCQMIEDVIPMKWRILQKQGVITTQLFDDYLFAADAAIFHKFQSREHAVVSSTVFQALGAGCPIFVPQQSDFFHTWKDEVVHYEGITDLNEQLIRILYDTKKRERLIQRADKYVKCNSPEVIAQKFLDVYETL